MWLNELVHNQEVFESGDDSIFGPGTLTGDLFGECNACVYRVKGLNPPGGPSEGGRGGDYGDPYNGGRGGDNGHGYNNGGGGLEQLKSDLAILHNANVSVLWGSTLVMGYQC